MKVTISTSNGVGSLGPTGSAAATRQARSTGEATSGPNHATSTSVSGPGQLMSKLSQLRDSDPEQLAQVVSSLANQLRAAAKQDSGMGGKMLTELASKLDDVANGGDISQLESPAPTGGARRPGGVPPAGAAAAGPPPGATADVATSRSVSAANAYRSTSSTHERGDDPGRAALSKMLDELDAALKNVGSSSV